MGQWRAFRERLTMNSSWKKVGEFELPLKGEPRVGLISGGRSKDPERWARFRQFRIVQR
jgi:hypothetical protein